MSRGEGLQAAEEDVGRGVGAGRGSADPADEGSEKWIQSACAGKGEAERGVETAVARDVADSHHGGDGDDGVADVEDGSREGCGERAGTEPHEETGEKRGEQNASAGCGEPVEVEDGGFCGGRGDDRRDALNGFVETGDGEFQGRVRIHPA